MLINKPKSSKPRQLFKVKELVALEEFNFLSENALRHIIFSSQDRFATDGTPIPGNGLEASGAMIRLGRRILIDIDLFRNWLTKDQAKSKITSEAKSWLK